MRTVELSRVAGAVLSAVAMLAVTTQLAAQDENLSRACEVGKRYMELVQKRDFEAVSDLFAQDAAFYAPTGVVLHGADDIRAFYLKEAAALDKLVVQPHDFAGDDTHCYFEIWTKSSKNERGIYVLDPDGEFVRGAIDHFTVDEDGLIAEFVAHS
ncbi:MAG: nuclear transport factor 2 family protein, partial [Rhodospirillaceae bacterium]